MIQANEIAAAFGLPCLLSGDMQTALQLWEDLYQNRANWQKERVKPLRLPAMIARELKRLALNTRAVCFGSLAQRNEVSRATINRFLDTMPDVDGQLKIFDINLRQDFYTKEVLRESFKRCNILKINDEELVTISRMFGYPGIDLQDKCWILLAKYNLKMLILTCGINGSYVFTPGVVSFQETPKVPVADTVGAGDSFTAAFCASILNGKSVPEAHKLAVEVSAYVCTQSGAMPELPVILKDRLL